MRTQFSERQIQIFNASIKLIGKGGIQNLTTKNLAKEVGISEAAIYRHFRSKVEILKGVLEFLKVAILNRLQNVRNERIPPIEKIKKIITEQSRAFTDRPEIVVVLLSEGLYQNEGELSKIIYSIMQESAKVYQVIIEEGQKEGGIRSDIDSKQITFIIMGTMRLNVIQWHLSGFSIDLNERCSQLFDTIFALMMNK